MQFNPDKLCKNAHFRFWDPKGVCGGLLFSPPADIFRKYKGNQC